jgi:thiol-disulfide isomerase/thioredoxin
MNRTLLAVAGITTAGLVLAGCGGTDDSDATSPAPAVTSGEVATSTPKPSAKPAAKPSAKPSASAEQEDVALEGRYIDYADFAADPASFAAGDVVLFFNASWCPKCQETDANIGRTGLPDDFTLVRVDFDSETSLRQKYGVTLQHTFVQIDEGGQQLAKWNGSFTVDDIVSKTV